MSTARSDRARRVLVTGMSGVGKSTVLTILASRGYRTVDLDDPGWSFEQAGPDGDLEQLWDEGRVDTLLAAPTGTPLVLSGCARNQGRFYDRLDAVLLLDVPEHVMLERIDGRTGNDFGKDPAQRARILADAAAVLPLLRRTSTAVVDATQSPEVVADVVAAHLAG